MNGVQAGHEIEVPRVAGGDRVAEFHGCGADDQISEGQVDSACSLSGPDSSDDLGGGASDGEDGHVSRQFIEKLPAKAATLGRSGPIDVMDPIFWTRKRVLLKW